MIADSPKAEAVLEVIAPDSTREEVSLTQMAPFNIGRGGEGDNTLQLSDGRISRVAQRLSLRERATACRTAAIAAWGRLL